MPWSLLKRSALVCGVAALLAASCPAMQMINADDDDIPHPPSGGGGGDGGGGSTAPTTEPYAIRGHATGGFTNGIRLIRAGPGGTTADYGYANLDELQYNCVTNANAFQGHSVVGKPIYRNYTNNHGNWYYSYGTTGTQVCTNGLMVYAAGSSDSPGDRAPNPGQPCGYLDLDNLVQNVASPVSSNSYAIVAPTLGWIKGGPSSMWDYGFGYAGGAAGINAPTGPQGGLLGYGFVFASKGNRIGTYDRPNDYDYGSDWRYKIAYADVDLNSELTWNQAYAGPPPPTGEFTDVQRLGGAAGVQIDWKITPPPTNN